jgi:hypothetical protein
VINHKVQAAGDDQCLQDQTQWIRNPWDHLDLRIFLPVDHQDIDQRDRRRKLCALEELLAVDRIRREPLKANWTSSLTQALHQKDLETDDQDVTLSHLFWRMDRRNHLILRKRRPVKSAVVETERRDTESAMRKTRSQIASLM